MNVFFGDRLAAWLRAVKESGTAQNLRLRLYLLFAAAALTVAAGLFSLLLLTGAISPGDVWGRLAFVNELNHLASSTERRMGDLSAMTLQLGRALSGAMERFLKEREASPEGLMRRPELLGPLLSAHLNPLLFGLSQARTTGVFLALNATASLRLQEAVYSRAGLYLTDSDPEFAAGGSDLSTRILRGPAWLALERDLTLERDWAMEFDVRDAEWFDLPQRMAREHPDEAGRVCLWFPAETLRGAARRAMLCSAPLIDSRGNVFGVCGFDVTDIFFKRSNLPAANIYDGLFCALAPRLDPEGGEGLDLASALISWRWFADERLEGVLLRTGVRDGLTVYQTEEGDALIGAQRELRMQPAGLPFEPVGFSFALLAPLESAPASSPGRRLAPLLLVVTGAGLGISLWLLRRLASYLDGPAPMDPTELTDPIDPIEREFYERVAALSPAERAVFDLQLQGAPVAEIAQALSISPNTVKTHNRNIFAKMEVSSQRELLTAYINILKRRGEAGQTGRLEGSSSSP